MGTESNPHWVIEELARMMGMPEEHWRSRWPGDPGVGMRRPWVSCSKKKKRASK